jgi:hypothetical protein
MHWRQIRGQIIGGVVAVATAVLLVGGSLVGSGAVARAAPAAPAPAISSNAATLPLYGIPHKTDKVTLAETSLDGPALWTLGAPSAPNGPLMVLAWTRTDGRLSYQFGNGGIHTFIGSPTTLGETSFVRPAVVRGPSQSMTTAPVALAWTGTDLDHHVNVLYAVPGSPILKLTLHTNNSFTAPGLEWLSTSGASNPTLLLSWAGTNSGHALNLLPISITDHGLVPGTHLILWNYHSAGQPDLVLDRTFSGPTRYFLGWSDLSSHRLMWAVSVDGTTWTQQPTFSELSTAAPSLMGLNQDLSHVPPFWMTWTGTDPLHRVNVLYALDFTQATTNHVKVTLGETALGGSVVGFNIYLPGQELVIAWTGTDPLHHLNVATLDV